MKKTYFVSALIALATTLVTIALYSSLSDKGQKSIRIEHIDSTPASQTLFTLDENGNAVALDFTEVAAKVKGAVVHIKSTFSRGGGGQVDQENPFGEFFNEDLFERFFRQDPNGGGGGRGREPRFGVGSGSGVIISEEGFIVTNNHVIADAQDIEVTLDDNRIFKADLIGTDPTTDLAVIKIKGEDLTSIPFVNSDDVRVGQWVIAVGNPFNLTSTVTAGIVSAKGRSINILRERFAVESFIQTDAAINPGNSGGALVNLEGGLIGINTAIASPTGSYSGYGFAVPANLVRKVVEDLMEFGIVQRGVLGVSIRTVDGALQQEKDLNVNKGAYIDNLLDNSAAQAAGIEIGDVIVEVDGTPISSSSNLQEAIARHRPGDEVKIIVDRDGREKAFSVILNNPSGNTGLVRAEVSELPDLLGADFETLDPDKADELDIPGGVKVVTLKNGRLRKYTQMEEGFIITKVDGRRVSSIKELEIALRNKTGGIMLEGVYEDFPDEEHYYAFGMQ